MKKVLLLLSLFLFTATVFSQLLSWEPQFAIENTKGFIITLDAGKGNRELNFYTPATDVYVHIGVITNKSANQSDWKYVKFDWGTTAAAARATSASNNKWTYTFTGTMREFFGITDAGEHIKKIAVLFRNGTGNRVQRNADGSDMFIPVYTSDLAVKITEPVYEPTYIPVTEGVTKKQGDEISVTAQSNTPARLRIIYNGKIVKTEVNATLISASPMIDEAGNQLIVAEASYGNNTTYDTVQFFVESKVKVAPLPLGVRQGINYTSNTTATLVLFAPEKERVSLIGDFDGSEWVEQSAYQLSKTPDGNYWWITLENLTPKKEYAYQFLIDGKVKIADPYAQKILDPLHDKFIDTQTYPNLKAYPHGKTSGIVSLLQTGANTYRWENKNFTRTDKRELIIYELLVRDFVQKHNWRTLMDTISYFKKLGINAIELLPFNEFEGNESWGYNPNFYFAPDKYYGTAASLKEFIDSCHSNGIAVIMDMALNHSFGSSPMVQMYWDAQNSRPAANNPWFNPAAKHAFNVGYDFNHEAAATKYFVSRVSEHWLQEYKIDGFRWDLSKGFTQKQTCDNNGGNCDVGGWSAYDASRVAIWKGYYDTMQLKAAGTYCILEHFADNKEEKELADYGMLLWGNAHYSFNQATMGYSSGSDFSSGFAWARGWESLHLVAYMESHDEERLMYKNLQYGNSTSAYNIKDKKTAIERQRMAAAFFLAIPGPKMIWQFGELGYDYSINYCADGSISDDCRTGNKPIRWDYLQDENRKALFDVYSKMLHLRKDPGFKNAFVSAGEQNLSGNFKWIKLSSAAGKLVVVGNFDVAPLSGSVTFPAAGEWDDLFEGTTFHATGSAQSLSLQPGEFHVYISTKSALPVTFISFSGKNIGNTNVLEWEVQAEENLNEYTIERSENEQTFSAIGVVKAEGKQFYNYIDESPTSSALYYYRLKIADTDGREKYSDIISVKMKAAEWKVTAMPNPFRGELKLQYASPVGKTLQILLKDLQGRTLISRKIEIDMGKGQLELSETRKLGSGTYFLTIAGEGVSQTMKVIKNH